jgi:hypothetical protein
MLQGLPGKERERERERKREREEERKEERVVKGEEDSMR